MIQINRLYVQSRITANAKYNQHQPSNNVYIKYLYLLHFLNNN